MIIILMRMRCRKSCLRYFTRKSGCRIHKDRLMMIYKEIAAIPHRILQRDPGRYNSLYIE